MRESLEIKPWVLDLADLVDETNPSYERIRSFKEEHGDLGIHLQELTYLRYALDVSAIVAITNLSGKIIYVNDKFCEISKYSREELLGSTHRIVSSGHHDAAFFRNFWETITSGEIWEGEVKNRAKDGSYYWVKTTVVPLKDRENCPIMFIAVRTDITKGKLAQEQLLLSVQDDFRQVVASVNNLIFKVKKKSIDEYIFTLFEGKLAKDLNIYMDQVIGKNVLEIFNPEISKILIKEFLKINQFENAHFTIPFEDRQLKVDLSPLIKKGEITEIIGCVSDVTELVKAKKNIEYMAYHDILTDLPNRRKFELDFPTYLTKNSKEKVALFFFDIDRFKTINDSFGHAVGDLLIKEVAKILLKEFKNQGTIYRFAGDEFILILPNQTDESIQENARRILSLFDKSIQLPSLKVYATCSVGISVFPDHSSSGTELLSFANFAMHNAKNTGRNLFRIYDPSEEIVQKEKVLIENELRSALLNNEFKLVYQPKFNLKTNAIDSLETLIRWNSPKFGFVSPDRFIPIAEETGLIVKLDEWVLMNACIQCKEWNRLSLDKPIKIAVNISPLHFRYSNFDQKIKTILNESGLAPKYLELEITETSFIDNQEECIKTLLKLKEIGVSIAIDDFGTGFSSLNYLRKFPVQTLKIDRSFINEMAKNEEDFSIVKAIIYLAHELKLKVVAEGIETKDALEKLRAINCDYIQGYYISKPLPPEEFENSILQKY